MRPAAAIRSTATASVDCRHLLDGFDVYADGSSQPHAVILVRLIEVADHGFLDLHAPYLAEIGGQVLDQVVLLMLVEGAIEFARLAEIIQLVDRLLPRRAAYR